MGTPPHGHHVPNDRVSTERGQLHVIVNEIFEFVPDRAPRGLMTLQTDCRGKACRVAVRKIEPKEDSLSSIPVFQ
jgi:hypothetical protein